MENTELIDIWKSQEAKLEKALAINQFLLKETTNQKAKSSLQDLVKLKTLGVVAAVLYLLLLGVALYYAVANYSSALNYFMVSVAAIALVNLKGLVDYVKHLAWINNIQYDGSVLQIQEQLTRLQFSIIDHGKYMCLQFPFYTTFYLSNTWFPQNVGWGYLVFQGFMTVSFTVAAYWLFKNHTPKNLDKKWFRIMLAGSGGKSVMNALDFYQEMESFQKN